MKDSKQRPVPEALTPLPWDSEHFGFRTGRITDADLKEADLRELLDAARHAGVALVYWSTAPDRYVQATQDGEALAAVGRVVANWLGLKEAIDSREENDE